MRSKYETLRSLEFEPRRDQTSSRGAPYTKCPVFGSVLHGKDSDRSGLEILIDPTPETTLFDIGAIRHELLQLLGVPVDVFTPNALPNTFWAAVLEEARPV